MCGVLTASRGVVCQRPAQVSGCHSEARALVRPWCLWRHTRLDIGKGILPLRFHVRKAVQCARLESTGSALLVGERGVGS